MTERGDVLQLRSRVDFGTGKAGEPGRVGRLGGRTLGELDEKLRLILDL